MNEEEWIHSVHVEPMLEHLRGPEVVEERELFDRIIPIPTYPEKQMSERKARLFAVACCRQLAHLYDEPHCQRLIEFGLKFDTFEGRNLAVPQADCCQKAIRLAERTADAPVAEAELRDLAEAVDTLHHAGGDYAASHDHTDDYQHDLVATSEAAYAIYHACSNYPIRHGVLGQVSGAFENLGGVVWRTSQAAIWSKGLNRVQSTEGGDPDNMAINAGLLREIVGNPFRPLQIDPSWRTSTVRDLAISAYDERAYDRLPILADALEDAGCVEQEVLDHLRGPGPHVRGCWALDLVLDRE